MNSFFSTRMPQLLRAAIREILVEVDRENHRVEAKLHWWGGAHSLISIKKRIRPRGNKADPSLLDLVRQTAAELSDAEIARILNMKSMETPAGLRWTKDRVASFRYRHHIKAGRCRHGENYLTMKEAHAYLDISRNGLLGLVKMGAIEKNQITEFAPWKIPREQLDSEHVQGMVRTLKQTGRLPTEGWPKDQRTLFDDQH